MVKTCHYKGCHTNSRNGGPGHNFLPFPKPKRDLDRAKRWLQRCASDLSVDETNAFKDRYVCQKHFPPEIVNAEDPKLRDWRYNLSLIHI